MGCAASSVEKDERVLTCKERKRLMKQLVGLREEFADSQFAYLKALKNTGVTLRQFTESESLEPENTTYVFPSPPPPLPPSPPPLPFSPDVMKSGEMKKEESTQESMEIEEEDGSTPPPSTLSSSLDYWDPFRNLSQTHPTNSESVQLVEEENWAETKSEFEEEDMDGKVGASMVSNAVPEKHVGEGGFVGNVTKEKSQPPELVDDNSSLMSWPTKDTADMAMVAWRSKKTLESIFKDLDEHFLKASACWKDITVLVDVSKGDSSLPHNFKENKRKRSNSAKVFSALSWSWASKSLQLVRDPVEFGGSSEPCKPGGHCITIGKLYAAEQKLYKALREEEVAKLEYEKKAELLAKQSDENYDWTKTDKTRSAVESLDTETRRLQHSISMTCSYILQLIDEELYPQLDALTSGLLHMWRTMYDCHQMQNHISHLLNHIIDDQGMDLTSEYRRQATNQLEEQVTWWYTSFCQLVKSQKEYATVLFHWIRRTDCLVNEQQQSYHQSALCRLCNEWQRVLEILPDKVASEALKNFLLAIQSIILQQVEEHNLHKKSVKLETRLLKELSALAEMEKKLEGSFATGEAPSNLSPRHPLSLKRAKTEALQKRVNSEKAKFLNSVQVTKHMTINNLKTTLPNVFQALINFSIASAQAYEAVNGLVRMEAGDEASDISRN